MSVSDNGILVTEAELVKLFSAYPGQLLSLELLAMVLARSPFFPSEFADVELAGVVSSAVALS